MYTCTCTCICRTIDAHVQYMYVYMYKSPFEYKPPPRRLCRQLADVDPTLSPEEAAAAVESVHRDHVRLPRRARVCVLIFIAIPSRTSTSHMGGKIREWRFSWLDVGRVRVRGQCWDLVYVDLPGGGGTSLSYGGLFSGVQRSCRLEVIFVVLIFVAITFGTPLHHWLMLLVSQA